MIQVDGEINLGEAPGHAVCILEQSKVPIYILNSKTKSLYATADLSDIESTANVTLSIDRSG